MFVFMFAFLQQKMSGISDEQLGQIISTSFLIMSAVSAILPALVLQPLAKKLGRIKTHSYCLSIMTLAYLLVALFGHNTILLYLLMAIVGIGWAAMISLPFAIMSERVKAADMGLFMGLFNLSVVLPQLLVSLGVGLFISQFDDKSVVFYISATALCISSIAWFKVKE
jgi:MFS family permease